MLVVIPMAGRGSRYSNEGYQVPKPLIKVGGKPMVLWALQGLRTLKVSKYVFVVLQEHERRFDVSGLIKKNVSAPVEFIFLEHVTEGQLCTVLAARNHMDPIEDLLVASSDTLVIGDLQGDIIKTSWDGIISVADLPGEQWSFARTDTQGKVVEVSEKKRISDHASTGLYYFRRAQDLLRFADQIIGDKEKTRGEYYVMPVYQKFIAAGLDVGLSRAEAMWDMGTPEAKARFEKKYIANLKVRNT